ncbi:hypothetical protein AQJ23_14165 [Streptomyces antibioticus]|nr:hypothetical protein AQJ23_14165 [Streptomyces antibioticus]
MTTERVSGLSGPGERIGGAGERMSGVGERIEGAGAVTDWQEAELPAEPSTEIPTKLPTELSTEIPTELPTERRPRASVRVMPLWARPLAEPEEPGWSLAARRPATVRSLEGAGV